MPRSLFGYAHYLQCPRLLDNISGLTSTLSKIGVLSETKFPLWLPRRTENIYKKCPRSVQRNRITEVALLKSAQGDPPAEQGSLEIYGFARDPRGDVRRDNAGRGRDRIHVRDAVRDGVAQQVGWLPETQILSLDIVLAVRDQPGLDAFVADVSNPFSFSYRRYLTVPEFTARFGPTQADYDAVVKFAKEHGLTVTGGTRDGMEVQVKSSSPKSALITTLAQ